jgi:hypothetical protein
MLCPFTCFAFPQIFKTEKFRRELDRYQSCIIISEYVGFRIRGSGYVPSSNISLAVDPDPGSGSRVSIILILLLNFQLKTELNATRIYVEMDPYPGSGSKISTTVSFSFLFIFKFTTINLIKCETGLDSMTRVLYLYGSWIRILTTASFRRAKDKQKTVKSVMKPNSYLIIFAVC